MLADNTKVRPANLTAAEKEFFGRVGIELSGHDRKLEQRRGYRVSQLCPKQ